MNGSFIAQLAMVTVGLLHALMACAAWLLLRGPRQAQALHLWATGTACMALGCALAGLADMPPTPAPGLLRTAALPALLLAAVVLRVLALRRHAGRPLHLAAGLALAGLVAAGWVLCLQSDDLRVRQSYATAVLAVGSALIARHAWDGTPGATRSRTARWLAATEGLFSAALALRLSVLAAAGVAVGRWDWWLVMATAALAALFGNLGFLGMVMDDLHRAELQARQAQIDETASREAAEQTAQALQELLAQRDELAEEHDSLLQILAHEIRAPLQQAEQAMHGAVQVLHQPRGASAAQVNAQLLQAEAVLGEVRAVLDNTLAAATLLSRETPLVRQEMALDFLVELTLGDLGPHRLDRLSVEWLTDLDSLEVEPGLVRLALRNLLLNAFAHGGPQVQVHLRIDEQPATHSLRLVVADDGPGIPPERLRPPPGTDAPGRQQLGLNVVRQIMDLHGGQLILSNELPRGFVAQLVFPLPDVDVDDEPLDGDEADDHRPGARSPHGKGNGSGDGWLAADADDQDDDALDSSGWRVSRRAATPAGSAGAALETAQAGSSGARKT